MCEPIKHYEKPLQGAVSEIVSGLSALNMHPNPIPPEEQQPGNNGYLSETDRWVEHAYEHFRRAIEYINKAENSGSWFSVKLLIEMLEAGHITDREALKVLGDIQDRHVATPGSLRKSHLNYTRIMNEE